mgnify:CR=1 FL=1
MIMLAEECRKPSRLLASGKFPLLPNTNRRSHTNQNDTKYSNLWSLMKNIQIFKCIYMYLQRSKIKAAVLRKWMKSLAGSRNKTDVPSTIQWRLSAVCGWCLASHSLRQNSLGHRPWQIAINAPPCVRSLTDRQPEIKIKPRFLALHGPSMVSLSGVNNIFCIVVICSILICTFRVSLHHV